MKRFAITFCAYGEENQAGMLRAAAKILEELQAVGMPSRLSSADAPWKLALEGYGEPDYIRRHVLDLWDKRRGTAEITEIEETVSFSKKEKIQ